VATFQIAAGGVRVVETFGIDHDELAARLAVPLALQ